jgi:hypothetical protein
MGLMIYQSCEAIWKWGERQQRRLVASLGRLMTAIVSRVVCVGGEKKK